MMIYQIKLADKTEIKAGDTILCDDGNIRTVCKTDFTTGFMGLCIFGNSYKLGYEKVKKVIILNCK